MPVARIRWGNQSIELCRHTAFVFLKFGGVQPNQLAAILKPRITKFVGKFRSVTGPIVEFLTILSGS